MSNSWRYQALLSRPLLAEDVSRTLAIANAQGYDPHNPGTGRVSGITLNGLDERDHATVDEAIAVVAREGGTITLWKGEVDVSIAFYSSNKAGEGLACGGVDLYIDNAFFRDDHHRAEIAVSIKSIFVSICDELQAFYEYATDEELWELVSNRWSDTRRALANGAKPPVLFWLNYYDLRHFMWASADAFVDLPAAVTRTRNGVLVSFFEFPWQVNRSLLKDLSGC